MVAVGRAGRRPQPWKDGVARQQAHSPDRRDGMRASAIYARYSVLMNVLTAGIRMRGDRAH